MITCSPTLSSSIFFFILIGFKFGLLIVWITAISASSLNPKIIASLISPLFSSIIKRCWFLNASFMTWKLVTIFPSLFNTTPEPLGKNPVLITCWYLLIPSKLDFSCHAFHFLMLQILTTEGEASSRTSGKLFWWVNSVLRAYMTP